MSDKDEYDKALEGVKVMTVGNGLVVNKGNALHILKQLAQGLGCTIVHERIVERKEEPSMYHIHTLIDNLNTPRIKIPRKDNSFRGGSIGKGGKVKYRRK